MRTDGMAVLGDVVGVAVRMPDGKVLLTVPEAAAVWQRIGNPTISVDMYRRKCQTGKIQALGIEVSEGPRFLTDLDSMLAYFDRELAAMRSRLDDALAERKQAQEQRGWDDKSPAR
jgi:hypothetical protein